MVQVEVHLEEVLLVEMEEITIGTKRAHVSDTRIVLSTSFSLKDFLFWECPCSFSLWIEGRQQRIPQHLGISWTKASTR